MVDRLISIDLGIGNIEFVDVRERKIPRSDG